MLDVKIDPLNDSGGGGAVSTAADYLRFCQMMLNGGTLDGRRCLSPTTVKLMASDRPAEPSTTFGAFLLGRYGRDRFQTCRPVRSMSVLPPIRHRRRLPRLPKPEVVVDWLLYGHS
jgi:CubicO group peptidase (beta-lactamase class C family)